MSAYWSDWQLWLALAASGFLLAYLNSVEAAFLSVNDVRVQHRAEGGDERATFVAEQLADREGILSFLLFATKFASCFLAMAFLRLLEGFRTHPGRGEILLLCLCSLFVVLAQRIPSVFGSRYADRVAIPLVWPLRHLYRGPLRVVMVMVRWLVRSTGRFLGSRIAGVEPGFKFDELRLLLEASENRGVLEPHANRMLQAILGLGKVPVRRAMLPLDDTVMVPADTGVAEAARRAAETGFSRLPIYQERRDRIDGYVHVIDLLVGNVRTPEQQVREHKQEILRISPEDSLVSALRLFRSSRYHMAAVVGKGGEAVGVLTIEDVLERIVGSIEDEHDKVVGAIREAGPEEWVTDPHAPVDDLRRVCGLEVPAGPYRTIGGFFTSREATLENGSKIVVGEYTIRVEEPEGLSVPRLRIRRKLEETA